MSRGKIWSGVLVFAFLIAMITTILQMSGMVSLPFRGYGVDSSGNLYVARGHMIEVFSDGKLVRKMTQYCSRGFLLKVLPDDTLLILSSRLIKTDLMCNDILERIENPDYEIEKGIRDSWEKPYSSGGAEYTVRYMFFPITIYRNGVQIYQMPVWEFFADIMWVVSIIVLLISLCVCKTKGYFVFS